MKRRKVKSSYLVSVGYDLKTRTLEVEIHDSGVFQYFGVPPEKYEGLMLAESKGTYFIQFIKTPGYRCTKAV